MKPGIKVFAPATISNICVGFDILGLALEQPGDEILVREGKNKGLVITEITGARGLLSKSTRENTAGLAAQSFLESIGESDCPIEMIIHKKMGIGSGLGSSAASAVGGVYAVSEWLRTGYNKMDLLPFAMKGEKISDLTAPADNVAPSMLGGIILIRDNDTLDVKKLPLPAGLYVAVIFPQITIKTKDSRSVLPKEVNLKDVIKQQGNLGAFIAGMYTSDFELIRRSMADLLIEPHRSNQIPLFEHAKSISKESGALGFGISGSGPTMFALCSSSFVAGEITEKLSLLYEKNKIPCQSFVSKINQEGVTVL